MFITIEFQSEFEDVSKATKINMDPEYNESVENIKVLITLKFTELEMNAMQLFFHGKKLRDSDRINLKGIKEGDTLQVKKREHGCGCF